MLKEKTMDEEIRQLRNKSKNNNTRDEDAFLEGALFALEWMKTNIRSTSPSRFIKWRKENNNPYTVYIKSK